MDLHRGVRVRKSPYFQHGPVVQRPSIRPCQGRDRRFESGRDRNVEHATASSGAVVARGRTLMIRPSRIATLNWRFRRGLGP